MLHMMKIIPFNFSRKYDFTPDLVITEERLDVVYSVKLLGIQFSSDCRWNENTSYLINKANTKLWFLQRLKGLGHQKSLQLKSINCLLDNLWNWRHLCGLHL